MKWLVASCVPPAKSDEVEAVFESPSSFKALLDPFAGSRDLNSGSLMSSGKRRA